MIWISSSRSTEAFKQSVADPPLPPASKYSMLAISAYIPDGLTSRVHHHSGVEAFCVVDGEQCLQTPTRAYPMRKGDIADPSGDEPVRVDYPRLTG
jgi:hypothetical protein